MDKVPMLCIGTTSLTRKSLSTDHIKHTHKSGRTILMFNMKTIGLFSAALSTAFLVTQYVRMHQRRQYVHIGSGLRK
jgi:hypothetical protein